MTAEQVAVALGTHTVKAGGGFMACCPAHDDKNPSLAIDENNGSLLVKCFAGCEQGSVVEALKARDLWPGNGSALPPQRKPVTRQTWTPVLPVPDNATPPSMVHYRYGEPSMVWRYLSADGCLLQFICRYDAKCKKQILPLTWCTDGKKQE
jgi:hypothetical protein